MSSSQRAPFRSFDRRGSRKARHCSNGVSVAHWPREVARKNGLKCGTGATAECQFSRYSGKRQCGVAAVPGMRSVLPSSTRRSSPFAAAFAFAGSGAAAREQSARGMQGRRKTQRRPRKLRASDRVERGERAAREQRGSSIEKAARVLPEGARSSGFSGYEIGSRLRSG